MALYLGLTGPTQTKFCYAHALGITNHLPKDTFKAWRVLGPVGAYRYSLTPARPAEAESTPPPAVTILLDAPTRADLA